ncbi:P-loop containing nucleoside triphosphate hydrolase protein [Xylariaceae sp. FL0594]|nr:P-loop containing nucleoside triphosphate hydrolase protein [Xylariaceae sp. FL0594]
MASVGPRRRSRTVYEEDEDIEPTPPRFDSSKRQKRAVDGHASGDERTAETSYGSPVPSDDEDESHASRNGSTSGPNGGFHPGAIVRVRVENFVTYNHAEFLPGPSLNMVIGPNGTGKSSLVCAICLGLGYHPKHLGRASHVGEFVKNGEETATIEVELQKRPQDRANYTVRVQINREDNGRKWWLNNRESTHKAVQELTRKLRIQIDNLCQFLPQDKVAEFAGLTPTRLLEETLRAAAPEEVLAWQVKLKQLHKDGKDMETQVVDCSNSLKNLESRQQGLQADVDRLHEREAIEKKVQDLRNARVTAQYNETRQRFSEAKERKREARKKLQDLERSCGPALEAVNQKKAYLARIKPVLPERQKALQDAVAAGQRALEKIGHIDEKLAGVKTMAETDGEAVKRLKGDIRRKRSSLTEFEARLKNKPPEFVAAEWNTKIRQHEGKQEEKQAELRTVDERLGEIQRMYEAKKAALKGLQTESENLNTKEGQKLKYLEKVSPDAARGWKWLQENQDQFEKEVFGPPMLTCSITDQKYSDVVQSLLSPDDFTCFICQTAKDHKKLSNQFNREMGIAVTIRTCGSKYSDFRPAIPKERLREFGLDAYAIDFLEGPEAVLATLCAERRLHMAGVALRDISNAQYEQLMAVEKISSWATGKKLYRVARRREYGPGATSTSSRPIWPGRFWKDQPVDEAERAEIRRQIEDIEAERLALKPQGQELKGKRRDLKAEIETLEEEIKTLREQKNELQKAATQYAALGDRIITTKQQLESFERAAAEQKRSIAKLKARYDNIMLEKARAVLHHKELLRDIRDAHQALLEAHIRLIEAKSDVLMLEERNKDIKQRLEDVRRQIQEADEETEQLREEAAAVRDKISDIVAADNELYQYFSELARDKTVAMIDEEIAAEESKLEYVHAVDPMVLREFRKRAQEIQNLTQKKEELTAKFDSLKGKMQALREKWEPRVDALVTKINDAFAYNFEQINCAGQVDIYKDEEDFEQWAIQIKVKFRQNETLQQLNQHRQSGGERAVSTIFYLMALQSMAQAPFRVVDEINQGMDPRNERMVHERMVEIACREHTSQYFLITPKLLTGLRYDPRMRILCIASGERMPPDGGKLDFARLVKIQRAITAAA